MPEFSMTIAIDPNGVVLTVCEGDYDSAEWERQRRALFESRYSVEDYDGRPVVTDLRRCRLPKGDWAEEFRIVAEVMQRERRKPFRRAIIVSEEDGSELAVALFSQVQKILHHPDVETRAFLDFDEGYAWALEGPRASETAERSASDERRARCHGFRGRLCD